MRRIALCTLAAWACGGPQIAPAEPKALKLSVPVTLETKRPREGEARTVHVRVWADAAVRAMPRWKDDITEQIDYATQYLTPLLGIRLQVDAIKDWDRQGDPHQALASLVAADPGTDVTWVLGYVAAPDVVTRSLGELGDAQPLGRDVVVRVWADKLETDALSAKIPDLSDVQRTEYLGAHKRHKETAILVHQLAASLGAIAESDPTQLQSPTYAIKQATFSDRNRELMQLSVDMRIANTADDKIAHALLDGIEKTEWGGWIATQHDEVVAALRHIAESTKAGKTTADVPTAAYEQFDRIRQLRAKDPAEALAELDNMLTAYPGNAAMHQLKCDLLLVKPGVKDPATRAACTRVSELAPGDPSVHLAVGEALLAANDPSGARIELLDAANKIHNLDKGVPEAWRRLMTDYHDRGYLTWTEEAIAGGHFESDPVAQNVAETRARDAVPRDGKTVKAEDEPAYVAAIINARKLVEDDKRGEAERALAAIEKKWPRSPGLEAERCELLLRGNAVDAARAACDRAIAADSEASWALYLAGVIALKDTSAAGTRAGIDRLKHAIVVDPTLGPAWRTLGKAFDRAGDKAGRAELAAAYQTKFGTPLPP